jgi:hypothetical protein
MWHTSGGSAASVAPWCSRAFPLRSSQPQKCCWFGQMSLASQPLPEAHDVQSARPERQIPLDRDLSGWEQVDRSRVFDVPCGGRRSPRRSRHRRGQGSQTCMGARSLGRLPHGSTRGVTEAISKCIARRRGKSILCKPSGGRPCEGVAFGEPVESRRWRRHRCAAEMVDSMRAAAASQHFAD